MKEGRWTAKLLNVLRAHPVLADAIIWKLNDRSTSGIPDFCIIVNGRTTWWEVKHTSNELSRIQRYYVNRMNSTKEIAFVIRYGQKVAGIDGRAPGSVKQLIEDIVVLAVQQ